MNVLSNILIIVFVLVGVAYLTILERKVSRYIQFRKRLSKVDTFLKVLHNHSVMVKSLLRSSPAPFSIVHQCRSRQISNEPRRPIASR